MPLYALFLIGFGFGCAIALFALALCFVASEDKQLAREERKLIVEQQILKAAVHPWTEHMGNHMERINGR